MPTNKLKLNDLPRALQRQLEWDVKFIKEFNETILIETKKMFVQINTAKACAYRCLITSNRQSFSRYL